MFKVTQKLKAVKVALKRLHRNKYTKLAARVESKEETLKQVQMQLMSQPNDASLSLLEKTLKEEYKQLMNAELGLMKQKAKVEWLDKMDKNFTFFHAKVKEQHITCRISSIHNSLGNLITNMDEVQNEFLNYYNDLLGNTQEVTTIDPSVIQNGPVLNDEQCQLLCKPVSDQEVHDAIFSIPAMKSPGT